MKDKYAIITSIQQHVDYGLRDVRPGTPGYFLFKRINSLLAELDKVLHGEQKEPLIAQLNASVKGKQK